MTIESTAPDAGANSPAGPVTATPSRFTFGSWLFLRLLALTHLVAFASFWAQASGLVGPKGLLPAKPFFAAVRDQLGPAAYLRLPSLCWVFGTETFLHVLCAAGVVLSLLLLTGVAPALCLALLWIAYLSICCAGQVFFNFQWDALLLEATLAGILLAPWSLRAPLGGLGALSGSNRLWRTFDPPRVGRWLLWWLLFRLMFLAGVVKLASGDDSWRDLTALTFHYETQPLPTPVAWYAHHLPLWWHRAECAGMFVIELVVPFFFFGPRVLRHNATLLFIAFMAAIALTGNYTYFNFLTVALCVSCLDDGWWRSALPARLQKGCHLLVDVAPEAPRWRRFVVAALAALAFAYTGIQALPVVFPTVGAPPGFPHVARFVAPFRSFNNYGLFAVMTRPRLELVFEGSDDSRDWRAYEFAHKPGELTRRPTWVAPHQPRLDWQLWFAALGSLNDNRWVLALAEHLLRGTPDVMALLEGNPFPQKPPRFVRIVRYEYHFTDPDTLARTGQWWRRTPQDVYLPPASLR